MSTTGSRPLRTLRGLTLPVHKSSCVPLMPFRELRHRASGHSYPGDTELSVHEPPTRRRRNQALLETVTGKPHFFRLVWQ